MEPSRSIISRYESKYLIPSSMVPAIRDFISATCSLDKNAGPDGRYTVNNLYFDTPDLRFYNDTKLKKFTRFKPRVRFYGDGSDGFLWLELKHKLKNVTWKVRNRIPVGDWGRMFDPDRPAEPGPARRVKVVESFEDALMCFGASPMVFVRYNREPYVSDVDAYGRITFDRQLSYTLADGTWKLKPDSPYVYYDDTVSTLHDDTESPVLLEIKTETSVPTWVINMIGRFNLVQRGFSKYCYAIDHSMIWSVPDAREPAVFSKGIFGIGD